MKTGLPVLSDRQALIGELSRKERALRGDLRECESKLRGFEDNERPAYEEWLRVELGPRLSALEEIYIQVERLRRLALRINHLVEVEGWHPREALYFVREALRAGVEFEADGATGHESSDGSSDGSPDDLSDDLSDDHERGPAEGADRTEPGQGSADRPKRARDWDAAEIEARRQAKRDAKRAARKERKEERQRDRHAQSASGTEGEQANGASFLRARIVRLYRALARRLHPDSPHAMRGPQVAGLWLEVQAAYDASDLDRLLSLSVWLEGAHGPGGSESDPMSLTAQDEGSAAISLSDRYERIRALEKSIRRMARRLAEVSSHPGWGFSAARPGERKKLRKRAARDVETELAQAQANFEALEDFIASIGPPRPPRSSPGKRRGSR